MALSTMTITVPADSFSRPETDAFLSALASLLRKAPSGDPVTLDVSNVVEISEASIQLIAMAAQMCRDTHMRCHIHGASEALWAAMHACSINTLFAYPTEEITHV